MDIGEISSTMDMLKEFAERGLDVSREMAEEIISRDDAARCIAELLKDDRYWDEISNGWFPIHAIFMLALIKTRESFEVLKWILENKADELEDWLPEDVPSLLFYFGKDFFDEIKEIALNKNLDFHARLAAAKAICAMGVMYEDMKDEVVKVCKIFLEDDNEEFTAMLLPEMAEIKDEVLFALVKQKFEEIPFAKKVTDMQDLVELHEGKSNNPEYVQCLKDPWEHFSEENLKYLKEIN